MLHKERIQPLHLAAPNLLYSTKGSYILLWVQATVRLHENHALQYAIRQANHLKMPVLAVFGLAPNYPQANARHYLYLLEGLRDLRAGLDNLGIPLAVHLGSPPEVALQAASNGQSQAALIVSDMGYLRHQRAWRSWLSEKLQSLEIPLVQVESEAVVPVTLASNKQEYAARTIRPKITRLLEQFLQALEFQTPQQTSNDWDIGLELKDLPHLLASLPIDHSLGASQQRGGEQAALERLTEFVTHDLPGYHRNRNDPALDASSRLSAYLHYGQLSPIRAALEAQKQGGEGTAEFLEELIVRRELSFNFCYYNANYDRYEGLPDWARATLAEHSNDPRPQLYSSEQLDNAQTHDDYWNAAQNEMVITGRMHNYMRMYWGKKILEWTPDPRTAFEIMLHLNNRYQQDGRDPNSFVGVLWVLGLHDRPWKRRPIFGTVRYMNAKGLERKFKISEYVRHINSLYKSALQS